MGWRAGGIINLQVLVAVISPGLLAVLFFVNLIYV
jgi:hypothetical protein